MENNVMLTTPQAAQRLNVTTARVRQLILEGRLPSQQFGRDHLINESDLVLVANRKPGRPPKPKDETGAAEVVTVTATVATGGQAVTNEAKPKRTRKAKATKKASKKGK